MEIQPAHQQPTPEATTTSATSRQAILPNIPDTWPGAWHVYKYSRQAVRRSWGVLLLIGALELVIAVVFDFVMRRNGSVIADLLNVVFGIATISVLLACVRGGKMSLSESLKSVKPMLYLNYILSGILIGVICALSLILLVVPFFFVFPRLLLSPYFLIDKNLDPLDAIRASWDASKGHLGKIWGIIGATIAIALLAVTIIGIPFAIYFDFMYSAAFVVLYEYIIHLSPVVPASAAAPVTNPQLPQAATEPVNPKPPVSPPTPRRPLVQ